MEKQIVCKTVTAFGVANPKPYVLIFDDGGFAKFEKLEGVAAMLRIRYGKKKTGLVFIKNEAPGDIIWKHDDTLSDQSWECERLTKVEMHQLALLLLQG
jgi:hypothetical protein